MATGETTEGGGVLPEWASACPSREALLALSQGQVVDLALALHGVVARQSERIVRQDEHLARQSGRIACLEKQVVELQRRLGMNSGNSSLPPSGDGPGVEKPRKAPTGRKPGGQPGHEGRHRVLVPSDEVDKVVPVKPEKCIGCGTELSGTDPSPYLHQVTEIPEPRPETTEYQLHTLCCPRCGRANSAELPSGVPQGGFGPRVEATVGFLSGACRLSRRTVETVLADLFGVEMSLGTVSACEARVSEALAAPVEEARGHVQEQAAANVDETGWRENRGRAWLWVMATGAVTVFLIHAKRSREAAQALLGCFAGVLTSDRWGAYNVYGGARQWCWAHLARDFQGFVEYGGEAARIGEVLLDKAKLMFQWWHRVRDGTLSRDRFRTLMGPVRAQVEETLGQGAVCGQAKVERSCKRILKGASFLWTFVEVAGIEPTNNAAERAIRPGVLWRKGSFGTHSQAGSRFTERILTAAATCRQQGRNVAGYLTEACHARLQGRPAPSLLPTAAAVKAA